jgi:glucose-6-phosphate 1-dehydrogenase
MPTTLTPEPVRDEKVKVLQAVHDANVVLGQHEGYKDNPTVAKDFSTCTFASINILIKNEWWDGTQSNSHLS